MLGLATLAILTTLATLLAATFPGPVMRAMLVIPFLVLISFAASAETIAGRASVIDGDTLEIHGERIRILDIDAPESRQTCTAPNDDEWRCGQAAANSLADWIGGRTVRCETTRRDKYGRHLARCTVGAADVATWLAGAGLAVPYRDCKCEVIRDAAARAKQLKRGIWSGTFMMPWVWRKAK